MISRRSFLIALTGLVTSSFVTQAKTHLVTKGGPMLLRPTRVEKTLYLYEGLCSERNKWLVCLGSYEHEEPPPPTWREYLQMQGHRLESAEAIERICNANDLTPEDLEHEIDEYDWADVWECALSPQAKAYSLLQELDVGCSFDAQGKKAGQIEFVEGGWHPGSSACWVELRNDLTVSLLQAHIIGESSPSKITI
jgi:hypothetical protein